MVMALDASATASEHAAGFDYLVSDEPQTIQGWDAALNVPVGDPIDVLREERTEDIEANAGGLYDDEELVLFTAEPLLVGLTYFWSSAVYTVEEVEPAAVGVHGIQSRSILRREAQ
jgi:hypothetical protein